MTTADMIRQRPFLQRLFFAIPVLGWMARDLIFGDKDNIWYALVTVVSLWLCATLVFGLPGLYIPALIMVPIMMSLIVFFAWG